MERIAEDHAKEFLLAMEETVRANSYRVWEAPMPTEWHLLDDNTQRLLIHTFVQLMLRGVVIF